MSETERLPPGACIGILGGGQLGRMLALAAARLGFDVHVFCPEARSPAARVAAFETVAPYEDLGAVARFAAACDVVTYEFENVPAETALAAAAAAPLRPGPRALETTQDRVTEKTFARACGAATTRFAAVDDRAGLDRALADLGLPSVLKTRRNGYDGKGQAWIRTPADAEAAWTRLSGAPLILEAAAPFVREVSIIAARGLDGRVAAYPLADNTHENGVLRTSRVPAAAAPATEAQARAVAAACLDALEYVGVLAIEFFELGDGALWVNEFAPRVHNSGHWSIEAAHCDQFEMHIRAITGWRLGDPGLRDRATMVNLLGQDEVSAAVDALCNGDQGHVHLYGKHAPASGRKAGHVTHLGPF